VKKGKGKPEYNATMGTRGALIREKNGTGSRLCGRHDGNFTDQQVTRKAPYTKGNRETKTGQENEKHKRRHRKKNLLECKQLRPLGGEKFQPLYSQGRKKMSGWASIRPRINFAKKYGPGGGHCTVRPLLSKGKKKREGSRQNKERSKKAYLVVGD